MWTVALALAITACYTWAPTSLGPRELLDRESPSAVLITRMDGSEAVVRGPRVIGDSLYATSEFCQTSVAAGGRRVCQPVRDAVAATDEIQSVDVRAIAPARTAGAVLLAPVALLTVLVLLVCSGDDNGGIGSPCG